MKKTFHCQATTATSFDLVVDKERVKLSGSVPFGDRIRYAPSVLVIGSLMP